MANAKLSMIDQAAKSAIEDIRAVVTLAKSDFPADKDIRIATTGRATASLTIGWNTLAAILNLASEALAAREVKP